MPRTIFIIESTMASNATDDAAAAPPPPPPFRGRQLEPRGIAFVPETTEPVNVKTRRVVGGLSLRSLDPFVLVDAFSAANRCG